MNRYRTTGVPAAAAMRGTAFSSSRGLEIPLITLDNCAASGAVYPALTSIRKDCGDNRQKAAGCAFGATKADARWHQPHVSSREIRQRRPGMALKVELKPHERIIIGACVVTNTDQRARLLIDGDNIPILREKDILTPETADTPAKLVYLAVQLMYISPDPQVNHGTYFNLLRDIVTAVPSAWPIIEGINNHILNGDLYQALKEAKKLVAYERQLLDYGEAVQANAAAEAKRTA
jgi:flagellar biosynthesis repressor protein FlbT